MRIFGADVDVALGGADRDAGNGHAFDHDEGIAFHDHAIGKCAAVAFVGVADDVFLLRAGLRHRFPLDAGWKACAASAAQSRRRDVGEDGIRGQRQRPLQPLVAVMGAVIRQRTRVDHAAPRKCQAGLPLQPGNLLGEAKAQPMRAVSKYRVQYGNDVRLRHRAIGDPPLCGGNLDHWLQPVEAAGTGSDDLDGCAALHSGILQGQRDLVGADRYRPRIARDKNALAHRCASAISASMRASSSRPTRRPSSIADGAVAQSPRQ
jgi:hypothetical protein